MTKKLTYILFCIIILSGCKYPNENRTTSDQIPPVINDANTSLSVINIGALSIPAEKSTIDTVITVYVSASDGNGLSDISTVTYSVVKPDGNLLIQGSLSDNGQSPDITANDGKYNSNLLIKLPKDIIGIYQIQFQTIDHQGFTSILQSFPIRIFNSANTPPTISNCIVPDTVFAPSGNDVNYIQVSITVSDNEGLTDIVSVSFASIRPDQSIVANYPLFDDGGTISRDIFQPFTLTSGDQVAGDGVYSLKIPVTSSADKNYRDFQFRARDQSNTFSNIITKRVYIQ